MQRVLSTHVFVNHRLTVATLSKIQTAGIPAVEIFCARQHLDYQNKSQIAELGHWFRDSELKLHSIHLPMYNDEYWGQSGPHAILNISDRTKAQRIKTVDEIKRAIEIVEAIPAKYAVQHLGSPDQEFNDWALEAAFSSLDELRSFGKQRGVEVLLENIPNGLSSAERLRYFLGVTHLDIGFVFDLGHAHIMQGIEHEFEIMKERIRSTHVHDNDGKDDKHFFPMAEGGTVDWSKAMRLLRTRPNQYPLLLELKEVPGLQHPLDEINRVFDRLEGLE
ncbi:MAG TPA: sugar phosphate isomerase/epimerase family protein [Bryobacteraceae bacterium]|jgi:sugar phosphate isomerase/epimerase